jgi:hypothetical protein
MIFYYPLTKTALVGRCATEAADEFDAARRDEEFECGIVPR